MKAAIGEDADDEELGGAELHAVVTGTRRVPGRGRRARARARARAVRQAGLGARRRRRRDAAAPARPPRYDPEELLGVVLADYREPYDVREVIARLVDDSDFLEFKALYGPHTVCGHARIEGHACGIIGNNGPHRHRRLDQGRRSSSSSAARSGTPIVYLQNTTGYMVGKEAEQTGIVKHGSKMIQAVANATVPQLTLHRRRLVRRRQLRHVRARLRPALHLRLAQRAHRRDGRRAGRQGDGDHHRSQVAARGPDASTPRARPMRTDIVEPHRPRVDARSTRPRGCGTTASSTRATPGACSRSRSRPARGRAARAAAQHVRRREVYASSPRLRC